MAATGASTTLAERRDELTPMLSQYLALAEDHPDAILLFQVGDFYEAFCEAAEVVARRCEVTLTSREDSTGEYAMAGIPIDNAATYLDALLDAGYRVAVADQVQDPDEATGVVDRAVTRVVTPGTVVDDELLGRGTSNYVAAVAAADGADGGAAATDGGASPAVESRASGGSGADDRHAVAFVDAATGEFRATSGPGSVIADELDRVGPAEVLLGPAVDAAAIGLNDGGAEDGPLVTPTDAEAFGAETAADAVAAHVGPPDALLDHAVEERACGAALDYVAYTQGGTIDDVTGLQRYEPDAGLRLDAAAMRSLELFDPREGDGRALFDVVDATVSAIGRRRLERWLRRPLGDSRAIGRRLDAVAALVADGPERDALRDALRSVYDLDRLATRVGRERADALDGVDAALLEATCEGVDTCADVRDLIDRAVVEDPPQTVTEGGVIREGFDEDLDTLRETAEAGREWIDDLEARERERTGIDSLSVGYTEVHGYYIEVTDPNLDRVPDDYQRRQTLKNAERFVTPDLKQREEEILSAGERADEHEYDLFREVRTAVADETERLRELADALADIDAVAGLAETAVERDYVRPTVDPDLDGPRIAAARHPVVETTTRFVPNDADLTAADVTLLTGPNMSGKSTFMRSVALVQILAQAGSFVPADAARLPVVDRVFTRVGASDDIAGGESTFMREMRELATVLHAATPDSLVLLDEVGRGTSTADGRAIARAAIEYLHDDARATTLFATHYHDLTADAERLPRARNLHFAAERDGDDLTFLHAVADGPAEGSYGVGVARMAGLPEPVIERAAADASDGIDADQPDGTAAPDDGAEDGSGPDVTPDDAAAVVETLRELSVADTTPLEALETLHDLKERVE